MRWVVVFVVGCYHGNGFAPCAASCSAEDPTCPEGQSCGADFQCHGPDVASCTFDAPRASDAGPPDAPPDAPYPCYAVGFSSEFRPVCPDPSTVVDNITLSLNIDTDHDARCVDWPQHLGTEPDVCLIVANTIDIQANAIVRARGSRTLALVATQTLTIPANAGLDVGSTSTFAGPGFGAGIGLCSTPRPAFTSLGICGGGGGGGSFAGAGGIGGISYSSTTGGGAAGGKTQVAMAEPTFLRAGCGGSDGYLPNTDMPAGNGRKGGGAAYLVAGQKLEIAGSVNAGGAGGFYATSGMGGAGGGGSGGMIVLEAPTIALTGTVTAHGGGGGGGNGEGALLFGGPGKDSAGPAIATGGPGGGDAGTKGGVGGTGSLDGDGNMGADSTNECGGGGGGGAGFIFAVTSGAVPTTSPPAIHKALP